MKKTVIFLIVVLMVIVSCKSTKKARTADNKYQTTLNQDTPAKVFSVPEEATEPKSSVSKDAPITVKKEDVSFIKKEDETNNDANSYFIIVGSFSVLDNAKKHRETLISEGFTPIILQSNTSGYYRVCVNSFKNEMDARKRVQQIRKDFPQHLDSWLLFKE